MIKLMHGTTRSGGQGFCLNMCCLFCCTGQRIHGLHSRLAGRGHRPRERPVCTLVLRISNVRLLFCAHYIVGFSLSRHQLLVWSSNECLTIQCSPTEKKYQIPEAYRLSPLRWSPLQMPVTNIRCPGSHTAVCFVCKVE